MSDEKEKIFLINKFYRIFPFIGFIIILICFIGLTVVTYMGGVISYMDIGIILLGSLIYLFFYFYYSRLKILVSSEAIEHRQFIHSPLMSRGKLVNKISWEEIKELKRKKDITGSNYYYVTREDGKYIFFWAKIIENGKELVEYIETKTGKKFEDIKK